MIELRPMEFTDLQQVHHLECLNYQSPWSLRTFEDCLLVGYEAWVASVHEGVRGFILMSMKVGEAHLLNICVDPHYHQNGIGSALLEHMIEIARVGLTNVMFLEVRTTNLAALTLYQKFGFGTIGYRKNYYDMNDGTYQDAHVLSLLL